MTYKEALDALYSQLPMFQRQGAPAFKKDLTNTTFLCEYFDDPQEKFKSIHVAGTNGKGSVSHLLASVFQEAGYKVGLYTSPHLKDFRERIKINGEPIPEEKVIDLVQHHLPNFQEVGPSFFEMTVALAFKHFAEEKVDIAIVETGLGGRLDSTNVINPELSVITNIGLDHQQFLGETIQEIAGEKAGIIKQNVPVVIGSNQVETDSIFVLKSDEKNATAHIAEDELDLVQVEYSGRPTPSLHVILKGFGEEFNLKSGLAGSYQAINIRTVGCAIQVMIGQGWIIGRKNFAAGISKVVENTGLHGRWETLAIEPLTICDCGHNLDGITEILKLLEQTEHAHLHIVWGMVSDKDHGPVLGLLPKAASYYFCAPDIPRALDAESMQLEAGKFDLLGHRFPTVKEALNAAQAKAGSNDLIFIGGSTFVVAEVV